MCLLMRTECSILAFPVDDGANAAAVIPRDEVVFVLRPSLVTGYVTCLTEVGCLIDVDHRYLIVVNTHLSP